MAAHIEDRRDFAPSADRNKQPVLEALQSVLDAAGFAAPRMLEVASGTGQHAAHIAAALPQATLQPTELTDDSFASIQAWCDGCSNVKAPTVLDASSDWQQLPESSFEVVMVANMTHISPWECTLGLCKGAAKVLVHNGRLLIYGPFKRDGQCTTESNAEFDRNLRARDPSWGYRDVSDVEEAAAACGLHLQEVREMPANNFYLVFAKGGEA